MKPLNFCERSGYAVGPDHALADDPVEFHQGEEVVVVGCNRLACMSCNQPVRAEPDPLPSDRSFRVYACSCTTHEQYRRSLLSMLDASGSSDGDSSPYLPWRCAGHPVATLPLVLDGCRIAGAEDIAPLVRTTLAGWSPASARPDERESPIGWVLKLHARLIGSGLDETVSREVAACATDGDPRVREAALRFFARCPQLAGAETIEDLVASGDRSLFATPDPFNASSTSEDTLLLALGRRLSARDPSGALSSPRALELAKQEVVRGVKGTELLDFIVRVEPNWIVEHAEDIARAHPKAWEDVLDALAETDSQGEVGVRLARLDEVDRTALEQYARRHVEPSARGKILKAMGGATRRGGSRRTPG